MDAVLMSGCMDTLSVGGGGVEWIRYVRVVKWMR